MKTNTQRKIGRSGAAITLTIAAALLYGISSGIRANYGILIGPISENSGVAYAQISFVLAVSQLTLGIMQPVFGALSMKRSTPFVLRCGVALMVVGLLLIPFCKSQWTLMVVLGVMLPSGTAAMSFGIVMGVLTPKISEKAAPTASGVVTASSGAFSTLFSPIIQALSAVFGLMGTMVFLGIPSLLLLPVSIYLCKPTNTSTEPAPAEPERLSLMTVVGDAVKSRDYRFLLAGYFTCGFHMAIIETHLFTQITTFGFSQQISAYAFSACGIATMIGCVLSGMLCGRFPKKNVLGALYGSRCLLVAAFLLLPKTIVTVYGFSILLGLTSRATAPPTSGLTERLFGATKLATLFGMIFFSHQIGSFFSAWLGGICLSSTGGYTLVWVADIALCLIASLVSFKIRVK